MFRRDKEFGIATGNTPESNLLIRTLDIALRSDPGLGKIAVGDQRHAHWGAIIAAEGKRGYRKEARGCYRDSAIDSS